MRTHLSHLQVNVDPANLGFYRDLFGFLGWPVIFENEVVFGLAGTGKDSLWFHGEAKKVANDYDGPGLNHLGIGTETQAEVDEAAAWLRERGVELLFETPRHRPDFASSENDTYYQIMFESPDRILFEVVYIGPKD